MEKVAVIMGSDSDFPVLKPCISLLKRFGVEVDVRVMSAHRTPEEASDFAKNACQNRYGVLIAAAGKAAHLAGVLAAHTVLPVVGVPVKSSALEGLDALLSTVQMPPGIPVACVGIDSAVNAGLLAVQILSVKHPSLQTALLAYKEDMRKGVEQKDSAIQAEVQNI